ncbi:MAG TPA: glycosyltransferase family 2 protein [Rhizomicrobium sp.]
MSDSASLPTAVPQGARPRKADALVSIVIAFYNEEAMVAELFRELDRAIAGLDCRVEFVAVNDGSRDGTLPLLQQRLQESHRMVLIDLARNFGKEAALTAGLAQAKGDAVVVIDADLQDPPELIGAFLGKWREGFDVVYGLRTSRKADSWFKRTTANAFYRVFNRITDLPIPESAGDFRLMDRRVVDALLHLPERNRFMKGLFAWVGFRQTGIAFVRERRAAGRTSWNYWRLWNFALDGITSFSTAPLRLASWLGVAVSFAGFIYAAIIVARTLAYGIDVPGYASIMVAVMALGGVQLLCLGVIGEYLGRLYLEAKQRPLYVVAETYRNDGP